MLKKNLLFSFIFIVFFSCHCHHLFAVTYLEIIPTSSVITASPFQDSKEIYSTFKGEVFPVLDYTNTYYKIQFTSNKSGWIKISDAKLFTSKDKRLFGKTTKILDRESGPAIQSPYQYSGQENFRFPRRDKARDHDIKVDGFYEIKVSKRDHNPSDPSSEIYHTITNDPIYKKLPRDVSLKKDFTPDYSTQINLEGKLSKDLTVYMSISEAKHVPRQYDVDVTYKNNEIKFFNFDVNFDNGDFVNVKK